MDVRESGSKRNSGMCSRYPEPPMMASGKKRSRSRGTPENTCDTLECGGKRQRHAAFGMDCRWGTRCGPPGIPLRRRCRRSFLALPPHSKMPPAILPRVSRSALQFQWGLGCGGLMRKVSAAPAMSNAAAVWNEESKLPLLALSRCATELSRLPAPHAVKRMP